MKTPVMNPDSTGTKVSVTDKNNLTGLYNWPRVVAVTGALGSGKTEWCMDFADALSFEGSPVLLADMDIINPYFCLRSVADKIEHDNLSVLTPPGEISWGDLTYLNPAIRTRITDASVRIVLDVGGDSQGGLALKQFEPEIEETGYSLHFVINPFRAHTRTLEEVRVMRRRLESTSGLEVSGVVANAHLGPGTTPADCAKGAMMVFEFALELGLEMFYTLAESDMAEETATLLPDDIPLWPLRRRIFAPWERYE